MRLYLSSSRSMPSNLQQQLWFDALHINWLTSLIKYIMVLVSYLSWCARKHFKRSYAFFRLYVEFFLRFVCAQIARCYCFACWCEWVYWLSADVVCVFFLLLLLIFCFSGERYHKSDSFSLSHFYICHGNLRPNDRNETAAKHWIGLESEWMSVLSSHLLWLCRLNTAYNFKWKWKCKCKYPNIIAHNFQLSRANILNLKYHTWTFGWTLCACACTKAVNSIVVALCLQTPGKWHLNQQATSHSVRLLCRFA